MTGLRLALISSVVSSSVPATSPRARSATALFSSLLPSMPLGVRQDGFGYYQVTQKKGQRVSAADAYLTPVRTRANLKVIPNARTKRLAIDGI